MTRFPRIKPSIQDALDETHPGGYGVGGFGSGVPGDESEVEDVIAALKAGKTVEFHGVIPSTALPDAALQSNPFMSFSDALIRLESGLKMQRDGWHDAHLRIEDGVIWLVPNNKAPEVAWHAFHCDILAKDWRILS